MPRPCWRAQLSTLDGVAQVRCSASGKYAVRIQADPDALAARSIGIDTLANAIAAANINQATGALNGATDVQHHPYRRPAQQCRRLFRSQIIAYRNGAPVRSAMSPL